MRKLTLAGDPREGRQRHRPERRRMAGCKVLQTYVAGSSQRQVSTVAVVHLSKPTDCSLKRLSDLRSALIASGRLRVYANGSWSAGQRERQVLGNAIGSIKTRSRPGAAGSPLNTEVGLRLAAAAQVWTASDSCCRNLPFTIGPAVRPLYLGSCRSRPTTRLRSEVGRASTAS